MAETDSGDGGWKKPSVWLYIGAWVLASIVSRIGSTLVEVVLARTLVHSRDDLSFAFGVIPLVSFVVVLLIWIGIYSLFRSLDVGKVIPWLWGLGTLGLALSFWMSVRQFERQGLDPPATLFVGSIVGFAGFVLLFRQYFKQRGRVGP